MLSTLHIAGMAVDKNMQLLRVSRRKPSPNRGSGATEQLDSSLKQELSNALASAGPRRAMVFNAIADYDPEPFNIIETTPGFTAMWFFLRLFGESVALFVSEVCFPCLASPVAHQLPCQD